AIAAGAAAARRIAVLGTGYVGLTTGACLCSLGHRVICADVDSGKVSRLSRGEVDIREPGLAELLQAGLTSGRPAFGAGVAGAGGDSGKVCGLGGGGVDSREPGLAELLQAGLTSGRLSFVTGMTAAVTEAEMVFLCLPTPAGPDGIPDLSAVEAAVGVCRR